MRFLLDTNVVSGIMRGKANLLNKVRQYGENQCAYSVLTAYELSEGIARVDNSRQAELYNQVDAMPFEVLPLTRKAANAAGNGIGKLRLAGQSIDDIDALIAGHAQTEGLTLVTRNIKHFARWENLNVVNWEN